MEPKHIVLNYNNLPYRKLPVNSPYYSGILHISKLTGTDAKLFGTEFSIFLEIVAKNRHRRHRQTDFEKVSQCSSIYNILKN
jgi:hypothetical protein